jgi:hypothetical protein
MCNNLKIGGINMKMKPYLALLRCPTANGLFHGTDETPNLKTLQSSVSESTEV